MGDPALLLERLEFDPTLTGEIVSEMTVGETYFFRDPGQFDLIRDEVLPELQRARPAGLPLKIWSAGCSTGEEAYSLAVLAEEMGLGDKVQITGTDVSGSALQKAAAARYGRRSLRGGASNRMSPYLVPCGEQLRVSEHLRSRIRFDNFCLGRDELPSPAQGLADLDLIVCRNVLIYLTPDMVERIARQFYQCLGTGGCLLLGPSDPPLWEYAPFTTFTARAGVLYRRNPVTPEPGTLGRSKTPVRLEPSVPALYAGCSALERIREMEPVGSRLKEASLTPGEGPIVRRILSTLHGGATDVAAELAAEATGKHPLSARLHHLHGLVLMALGQYENAAAALRQILYLNRSLPVAHFLLGKCCLPNDHKVALRAFETAHALCAGRPPDERVELMEGFSAGQFAAHIGREIADLKRSLQDGADAG
ncbi:CheR family methyltransferase [Chelativorans sp. M5D2P16]|uniref:CheR family methyltransferase n=1 Tax=Chelativorans sp. M5D2P16 TaxID=3095678 RepID=UPI002ACAF594|nr:CheR family methyltransferase [Chelativorans sp. M5D2P16]MDZ5696192.1 CheR family methyltransferase [Chelativorans sp. M5D2P16]